MQIGMSGLDRIGISMITRLIRGAPPTSPVLRR
jgi:hypothetical protein